MPCSRTENGLNLSPKEDTPALILGTTGALSEGILEPLGNLPAYLRERLEVIMYKLSARQILVLALISALFAAGAVAIFDRLSNRLQPSGAAFSEAPPKGITDPSVATDEQNNIEVYRTLSPGVVFIHSTSYARDFLGFVEPQEGSGSGSIIDEQGDILTNYHVIEGAQRLSVSMGGQKDRCRRLSAAIRTLISAVIRLLEKPSGPLTVVPLGDSDKLVVGQKVLAIGNPFGLDRTLTTGVISGLQRPIRARNRRLIEGAIQTDASINPGNSGGPLLDSHGRMIGINSQILSPSGSSAASVLLFRASLSVLSLSCCKMAQCVDQSLVLARGR